MDISWIEQAVQAFHQGLEMNRETQQQWKKSFARYNLENQTWLCIHNHLF